MVHIVRSSALVAVVATTLALSSSGVVGVPLNLNPFTPGGNTIQLGRDHPALGNIPPAGSLGRKASLPVVPNNEADSLDSAETPGVLNKTTTVISKKGRRSLTLYQSEDREATEQSSKDIERLEAHFKTKMVVNYKELSKYTSGAAARPPWPSSYWPIYEDGINKVWNPEDKMPPSEKYARAYGLDPVAFVSKISEVNGIVSQASRQKCTTDDDCAPLKDGSGCGKKHGESSGHCIPKWFGICHAWAPAAIEEREPKCAVTKNNVTFEPRDIKALITQAYDGSHLETVFTGTRFNGADEPANLDEDGRFVDATRRDMGPGYFHIAITNIMGMNKRSFVVDVTAGAEVWNQPVRSYEIISATEMTPEFAATTFFAPRTSYVFNKDAAKIVFVQTKFSWIVESNENGALIPDKLEQYTQTAFYEYVLEISAGGDVVGGEWVRNSRKEHPDFLWFPKSQPAMDSVADVGIKYKEIRELLDASADCKQIPADGTTLAPATPAPTPAPVTPAPSTATPAPTPKPSSSGSKSSSSGSVAGEEDSDDISAGSIVPMPSPKPTSAAPGKPDSTATPSPSSTPGKGKPPAVVPVPTPAPVPAPAPGKDGKPAKGSVAPVVPAPAPTPAPAGKPSSGKPSGGKPSPTTQAPAAGDADDGDADDDSVDGDGDGDAMPATKAPPATTPAPTKKKTRCRVES